MNFYLGTICPPHLFPQPLIQATLSSMTTTDPVFLLYAKPSTCPELFLQNTHLAISLSCSKICNSSLELSE